jgi:hypothetical protein
LKAEDGGRVWSWSRMPPLARCYAAHGKQDGLATFPYEYHSGPERRITRSEGHEYAPRTGMVETCAATSGQQAGPLSSRRDGRTIQLEDAVSAQRRGWIVVAIPYSEVQL